MGLVGGMMNVVSLCCRPFVGNLADKISKYRLSTIGSLLMIVACVGYIFAPTPAVVVGARIINGVGFSLCSVCMATWISNLLPKERVGAGMGLYGTMNALAMAIAPGPGHRRLWQPRLSHRICARNSARRRRRRDRSARP